MTGRTKDEQFVIAFYEILEKGGDFSIAMDRYDIGRQISMNPKGVDATCKQLIRANFVKKAGDNEITLTHQGIRLYNDLQKI